MDRVYMRAWRNGCLISVTLFGAAWLDQAMHIVRCFEPSAVSVMTEHAEFGMRWDQWTAEEMRRAA